MCAVFVIVVAKTTTTTKPPRTPNADAANETTASPPGDENIAPQLQNGNGAHLQQLPLKLVMDPRGKMQDMNTLNTSHGYGSNNGANYGMMSPDKCAELVSALNAPKGKGEWSGSEL